LNLLCGENGDLTYTVEIYKSRSESDEDEIPIMKQKYRIAPNSVWTKDSVIYIKLIA